MKKFIFPVVAVLFLTLSSFNFLMAKFSANKIDFVLDQVEALANNEEGGAGGGCTSGGEGSTYCFTSWVTIYYDENGNELYSIPNECEIDCATEYHQNSYACCSPSGCTCISYT